MKNSYSSALQVFVFVCLIPTTHSFSITKDTKNYYTKENIEFLKARGIRVHNPMIIIINKSEQSYPGDPLRADFVEALRTAMFPILVSNSVFLAAFSNLGGENDEKNIGDLTSKNIMAHWKIYSILGSKFTLLIPNSYFQFFGSKGLKLDEPLQSMVQITDSLSSGFDSFIIKREELNKKNGTDKNKIPSFSINDFQKIFKTNDSETAPIWDFIIDGHGSYDTGDIAGLTTKEINELLKFFDNSLNVSLVYITSCFAGGKNTNLLKISETRIPISHNFIIIVGSITDSQTQAEEAGKQFNIDFFNSAAFLQDKGGSLNNLLQAINTLNIRVGSPHATNNIPQVWLPGGLGFQTFNIDERIFSLNNVLVKVLADENKPIPIANRQAVLVYPVVVKVPLIVTPRKYTNIDSQEGTFFNIWATRQLGLPGLTNFFEKISKKNFDNLKNYISQGKNKPSLNALLGKGLLTSENINENKLYLFPQFISMDHEGVHKFSEIIINTPNPLFIGVMQFLRDAFFTINGRQSKKIFIIDKIVGFNDLAALLESSSDYDVKHLLTETLEEYKDKNLVLEKVLITTAEVDDYPNINVIFKIGNTAWRFHIDKESMSQFYATSYHNFTQLDPASYEKAYAEILSKIPADDIVNQKAITEILKQKLTVIKKASPVKAR
jgi:hypothetical protein